MQQEDVDPQVVLQRVRNRIIEVLELSADFEAQRAYQRNVPFVSVPNEVINQWEDWYRHDTSYLVPPVFTYAERDAVVAFDESWRRVAGSTPNPLPSLEETQRLPEWDQLRVSARQALQSFAERGRLNEEKRI
jgi:hypothetical protein